MLGVVQASNSMGDKHSDVGTDRSIFVGDLADVSDTLLQETFASKYSSVKGAKVLLTQPLAVQRVMDSVRASPNVEASQNSGKVLEFSLATLCKAIAIWYVQMG
ncbi:hypothetical protein IFM89_013203 [Coptis chinensis]|uniref:Uncharacterized protein n=1 Tax=Coptis chinensis TaxID=261450 RepID=A0A835H5Q3_9MAGN|nr:hypothetical protein IFM89_013203 [Coptis chinensis]